MDKNDAAETKALVFSAVEGSGGEKQDWEKAGKNRGIKRREPR